MTIWAGGYVADIPYIEGFYSQQAPARMALACLLGGVACDIPDDSAHYLELGCGRGMGALLIAASNPTWQVTAIDYNPAHIASGVALARSARLENIRFLEADLGILAGSDVARSIPSADFVSLHGVWTWVSAAVRAGIVRLLADKVRPGGAVHLSYNSLPAWQGAVGLQRLIYEVGTRTAGRSDRQASAGIALAREIKAAGGAYIADDKLISELLDRNQEMVPEYVAHEYMNAHWAPAFHADVAQAMASAKLDWVASANPFENFPELMLTEAQRALYERYDDRIMRELVKDMCLPRQFRHDVFVRGACRIPDLERDATISALTVAPLISAGELRTGIEVPAGHAELGDTLRDMMAGLMSGPTTIGALLARAPGRSNPCELVGALVGTSQGQIVTRPGAAQPESADRLNRALGARVRSLTGPQTSAGLACGQLGTGVMVPRLLQFIAGRLLLGEREESMAAWVAMLGADTTPEQFESLAPMMRAAVEQRVPILRQLGIVPA